MQTLLTLIHLLICLGLVAVVLLQSGKGGGLAGGAFGGSAQTVFGGRGATDFITRATMVLGTLFFVTSLTLSCMSSNGGRQVRSVIQSESKQAGAGQPAAGPGTRATPPGTPPARGTTPAGPSTSPPASAPAAPPSTGPTKPGGGP